MQKLMIWAISCGQSTPKVRAICSICPPALTSASQTIAFMIVTPFTGAHSRLGAGALDAALPHEKYGVEHDRFSEGNGQDRLDQDLRGRARIAADPIRGLQADETHS